MKAFEDLRSRIQTPQAPQVGEEDSKQPET